MTPTAVVIAPSSKPHEAGGERRELLAARPVSPVPVAVPVRLHRPPGAGLRAGGAGIRLGDPRRGVRTSSAGWRRGEPPGVEGRAGPLRGAVVTGDAARSGSGTGRGRRRVGHADGAGRAADEVLARGPTLAPYCAVVGVRESDRSRAPLEEADENREDFRAMARERPSGDRAGLRAGRDGVRVGRRNAQPGAGPDVACVKPAPQRDVLVGVALSGGGSRAALFGASGLEALARLRAPGGASVLEQVDYLSSVSGGSVAASYYASQKPPRETAVLDAGWRAEGMTTRRSSPGTRSPAAQDFESALIWRHCTIPLDQLRARGAVARRYPRGASPGPRHVREPQPAGDARGQPLLIVNTTLYNNGRRLTFTTLPGRGRRSTTSSRRSRRPWPSGEAHRDSAAARRALEDTAPRHPAGISTSIRAP